MRQLATIRRIKELNSIPNSDNIEAAVVGGWTVVVKKGEFKVGDLAIYLEVDSFVPTTIAPFLTRPGNKPKEFNNVQGEVLKTVRLRGQISQGLLLPTIKVPSMQGCAEIVMYTDKDGVSLPAVENADITEQLGIQKWEPPIPAQLAGAMRGSFPSFIRKTMFQLLAGVL